MPFGIGFFATGADSDYRLLQTQLITSTGISQVDFTSIPSSFSHLQFRLTLRDNTSAQNNLLKIGFNNDLSNIYATHNLEGNGSSVISNNALSQDTTWPAVMPAASASSNVFGAAVIDILDYASTSKNKTVRSLAGYTSADSRLVHLRSGLWPSTNAITSVKFYTGGIAVGTRISLYGIRG